MILVSHLPKSYGNGFNRINPIEVGRLMNKVRIGRLMNKVGIA